MNIYSILLFIFCKQSLSAPPLPTYLTKSDSIKSKDANELKYNDWSSENNLSNIKNNANLSNCIEDQGKKSLLLWLIESPKQKVPSFLFGTIHVSYNEVWDYISKKVKEVFLKSESIVFELELQNPNTIELLLQCKNLNENQSLKNVLPLFLYSRLHRYMRRFKYKLLQWIQNTQPKLSKTDAKFEAKRLFTNIAGEWGVKRPVWLLFLLYQLSESSIATNVDNLIEESDINNSDESIPMLDVFLTQKAQELGKKLYSIETPAEQCDPLYSIDQKQIIFAINYTLSYLEWIDTQSIKNENFNTKSSLKKKSGLVELIEHYRCGSLEASVFTSKRFATTGFTVSSEIDLKAKEIDNLLVDDIILKRNIRMAERANNLLKYSPSTTFFFAIGAGHFLGEKSLIKMLENYGYSISPIKTNDYLILNSRAKLKFNELWVRNNNDMFTLPSAKKQNKNALIPNSQINQNTKSLKINLLMDEQNNAFINEEGIKISISLYEIPHFKTTNDSFFVYLNRNSATQTQNYAYSTLFLCIIVIFFFNILKFLLLK